MGWVLSKEGRHGLGGGRLRRSRSRNITDSGTGVRIGMSMTATLDNDAYLPALQLKLSHICRGDEPYKLLHLRAQIRKARTFCPLIILPLPVVAPLLRQPYHLPSIRASQSEIRNQTRSRYLPLRVS